jgi:hypothetical protein
VSRQCDDPNCNGFHDCWQCGGTGLRVGQCIESSCCCLDPEEEHGTFECDICGGSGGWTCPDIVDVGVRP